MLPVDGEEVVENDSDHGERAEHVSEEVEGVMGDHPAVWCGSSMRAGLRRNECLNGLDEESEVSTNKVTR